MRLLLLSNLSKRGRIFWLKRVVVHSRLAESSGVTVFAPCEGF